MNAPQVVSDDRTRITARARFVQAPSLRSAQNLIKASLVTFLFNGRQKCPSNGSRLCCIFLTAARRRGVAPIRTRCACAGWTALWRSIQTNCRAHRRGLRGRRARDRRFRRRGRRAAQPFTYRARPGQTMPLRRSRNPCSRSRTIVLVCWSRLDRTDENFL